jgi:hypothetical protein
MKPFGFLFLLILAVPVDAICQSADIERIVFKNSKSCERTFSPKSFFHRFDSEFTEAFHADKCVRLKTVSLCDRDGTYIQVSQRGDTTVLIGRGFMDLTYDNGSATAAYDSIISYALRNSNSNTQFWDFVKVGKFFCLDIEKSQVRIVEINTCVDPQSYNKIISALKKEGKYERLLAIRCGGALRDMVQYTR